MVDAVQSFPWLFLVITVMSLLGPGSVQVLWGIVNIRTARSVVLSAKETAYVEAARAVGGRTWRVLVRHVATRIGCDSVEPALSLSLNEKPRRGSGLEASAEDRSMGWQERIVADETVLTGKPVVRGTRLAVEFIIDLLAQGWSEADILTNYPRLCTDDIRACLQYAGDVLRSEKVFPIGAA